MTRLTLTLGALFGMLAVVLGALGAHSIKAHISPEQLTTWILATDYLSIHALALLALGSLSVLRPGSRLLVLSAWCFGFGSLVFCGSLFVRVLADAPAWGAVTPFGGTLLIAGWALLALGLWRAFSPGRTQ